MKKLESLNNAKFQNLSKEQMLKIEGGGKVGYWGDGYPVPNPNPSNPYLTTVYMDYYEATTFLGIRVSSYQVVASRTIGGVDDSRMQ